MKDRPNRPVFCFSISIALVLGVFLHSLDGRDFEEIFKTYCFDCHDDSTQEGGFDLASQLGQKSFDATLVFEKLINEEMPPKGADQPDKKERNLLLKYLAKREPGRPRNNYRRIGRREFNYRLNDLLGINLDVAEEISDDRGTHSFDTDRRILLTKERLAAYFKASDETLEYAFPRRGFPPEAIWKTNKIRDSHPTYNIYTRPYNDGILFSWTRANNGNSYSFFYDGFEPQESGWYEFNFDAAKVGDFKEDVTIQVHAGKYYFADDRPQPQRLLDVISLNNKTVQSFKVRGFVHPGENVSVHCYSKHNWRTKNTNTGAYIKSLTIRGPLFDWPPKSFQKVFEEVELKIPRRPLVHSSAGESVLKKIGGSVSVSSFQIRMEKDKMLDGSNRTFWHTRFTPSLAKPPHYVILENPNRVQINGLDYSTWSGGNGNGQVTKYEVYISNDQKNWGEPIRKGELETRLAAQQPIKFAKPTTARFIKFLITDSFSIDGRSLASIGKLDVMASLEDKQERTKVLVSKPSSKNLEKIIHRFAKQAFAHPLNENELSSYVEPGLKAFQSNGDFVEAAKLGLKSILCSHRFLFASSSPKHDPYHLASDLARTIWLSVPDEKMIQLAKGDQLTEQTVRNEIDRLFDDEKSQRMIRAFAAQWLNLRSFQKISPSLKLYPLYDDLLEFYLPKETEAYLRHLIVNNLSVQQLIDSDFSFLNQRLAQHYGIKHVYGQKLRLVKFPADSPRGGLLTMGSILKVTTDGFHTSPILRGAWISGNIAGNTLSPPPESVKAIEADTTGAKSLREQIKLHKNNESCANCHRSIDPYGFALENFDATGRWRKQYRASLPHKGTFLYSRDGYFKLAGKVDSSGAILDESFDNVTGLKKILLANHKKIAYNFMKKFFEFANGYEPSFDQRLELYSKIPSDAAKCGIKDMIKEVLVISFFKPTR